MPILLFFTLFALLDFVILFTVGAHIGLLMTLLLVLGTGFLGLHLIKREGVATLQRAQQRLAEGEIPSDELMTGAALIFGGALLMAPGFLSDTLGFLCLLPNTRRWLGRLLTRLPAQVRGFNLHTYRRGSDGWHETYRPSGARESDSRQQQASEGDALEGDFIAKDEPRQ
ncbi:MULTISPECIES: FxsA family protein [Modicisalibacter]|uniref:FxsA family protein n=1 Tax=Modicisalibacter TaxID=574347 RepID=UPI00100BD3AF|nr:MULTISPECIES: FxsA family protein [Halomonadaceae]MBZ9560286.1 FxsA family protein [Modicisalibacter sp. R2A 31.J]MBZ9576195.1 FxsA family protein [Modicisalibacter sp. MOD 31.J]